MVKIFISLFTLLFSFSILLNAQQIELFESNRFPAKAYGGEEEIESFFRQEMIYPEQLLSQNKGGSIFIKFKVNSEGKIIEKEIISSDNPLFSSEASRVLDKVLWMADKNREDLKIGHEKIKFTFNPKKYKRVTKKRGYSELPLQQPSENSAEYYTPSQLDEAPEIKDGTDLNRFISNNIKYPDIAYQRGMSGKVAVEFIIEPYGKATNLRIVKAQGGGFNDETIRLMKSIDWKAGIKDGKAVRTLYKYELSFVHPGGTVR